MSLLSVRFLPKVGPGLLIRSRATLVHELSAKFLFASDGFVEGCFAITVLNVHVRTCSDQLLDDLKLTHVASAVQGSIT
jgi:hypothetical protein